MKYLVIGLGVYGTNLALDLTDIGHEVIAVDKSPQAVERIKDVVATTYILDTANDDSMELLPLSNIDVAIVTIGNNFGASIKTVALLKKNGVKRLMVRASDELHESILEALKVERILTPEKKAAQNLVNALSLNTHAESFAINAEEYIIKFDAPTQLVGANYSTLVKGIGEGLKLIAATRPTTVKNLIGISSVKYQLLDINDSHGKVQTGDELTFIGSLNAYRKFYHTISNE